MPAIEPAHLAPRERPLTYPGRWPDSSVLVLADAEWPLTPAADLPVGRYGVARVEQSMPLDVVLAELGGVPVAERVPVLAIGSNACGAQMRHKALAEGFELVVPTIKARVSGLRTCFAPYVGGLGYVPATVAVDPGAEADVFVQFLDADQLAGVDRTEPGYRRALMSAADGVTVTLPSGEVLRATYAYLADSGHLVDDAGDVVPLGEQRTALDLVRHRSAALTDLLGDSAEEACRRVREQPALAALTATLLGDVGAAAGAAEVARLVDHRYRAPLSYAQATHL
jgi:hypothetical protein